MKLDPGDFAYDDELAHGQDVPESGDDYGPTVADPMRPGTARRIVEAGFPDPDDVAYDDEQAQAHGQYVPEVGDNVIDPLPQEAHDPELPDGVMPDGSEPGGCRHPASERRLVEGQQICLACGEPVEVDQALVPKDRPGTSDPTQREGDERTVGGLRHVTVPDQPGLARPYTPLEVEQEIVDTLDRIERGAGWVTTQEEKRAAAKLAYELRYARAMAASSARASDQRQAEALLYCRDEYEEWQMLELVCKTAREGLHNLRTKLSGLQTVSRSINDAVRGYR